MKSIDFLSKILWDLSNLDELSISELKEQLSNTRYEIASFIGIVEESEDDRDSCSHCGEYHSMSGDCPNDNSDNDLSNEHDSDHDKGYSQQDYEDFLDSDCGCSLGMDPNTECPTCS